MAPQLPRQGTIPTKWLVIVGGNGGEPSGKQGASYAADA
jgi:hypothetical protein